MVQVNTFTRWVISWSVITAICVITRGQATKYKDCKALAPEMHDVGLKLPAPKQVQVLFRPLGKELEVKWKAPAQRDQVPLYYYVLVKKSHSRDWPKCFAFDTAGLKEFTLDYTDTVANSSIDLVVTSNLRLSPGTYEYYFIRVPHPGNHSALNWSTPMIARLTTSCTVVVSFPEAHPSLNIPGYYLMLFDSRRDEGPTAKVQKSPAVFRNVTNGNYTILLRPYDPNEDRSRDKCLCRTDICVDCLQLKQKSLIVAGNDTACHPLLSGITSPPPTKPPPHSGSVSPTVVYAIIITGLALFIALMAVIMWRYGKRIVGQLRVLMRVPGEYDILLIHAEPRPRRLVSVLTSWLQAQSAYTVLPASLHRPRWWPFNDRRREEKLISKLDQVHWIMLVSTPSLDTALRNHDSDKNLRQKLISGLLKHYPELGARYVVLDVYNRPQATVDDRFPAQTRFSLTDGPNDLLRHLGRVSKQDTKADNKLQATLYMTWTERARDGDCDAKFMNGLDQLDLHPTSSVEKESDEKTEETKPMMDSGVEFRGQAVQNGNLPLNITQDP